LYSFYEQIVNYTVASPTIFPCNRNLAEWKPKKIVISCIYQSKYHDSLKKQEKMLAEAFAFSFLFLYNKSILIKGW